MAKGIMVVSSDTDAEIIFPIGDVAFAQCEEDRKLLKFCMTMTVSGYTPTDMRMLLADMAQEATFPLQEPKTLVSLIQEYEEVRGPQDTVLFHDFRTQYLDIVEYQVNENIDNLEKIVLFGYTCLVDKVFITIKVATSRMLEYFVTRLQKKCDDEDISLVLQNNIKWEKLQASKINTLEFHRNYQQNAFFEATIHYFKNFYQLFFLIDTTGFVSKKNYDMHSTKIVERNGTQKSEPIKKVQKYMLPYWKYEVPLKSKQTSVLYMRNDLDESGKDIDNYVYALHPSIMQYYVKNWFEDITEYIVTTTTWTDISIMHTEAGRRFNLYHDGNEKHDREIDLVVMLEKDGVIKLIAIECKKTLTSNEITETNKKCRERILKSRNNVFDAFIHVGCFADREVDYNKSMGNGLKYKQDLLSVEEDDIQDVPYFAFCIKSLDEYKQLFQHIISEIFDQW